MKNCAWCNQPLTHSWIRVGDVWIHAECVEEIATETETYMHMEKGHEEIYDYLYAPTGNSSTDNADNLTGDCVTEDDASPDTTQNQK